MPLTPSLALRFNASSLLVLLAIAASPPARADDVRDLEEELAVTVEDARPSQAGSLQFNGGFRYQRLRPSERGGKDEFQLTPRLQFGITNDFQLSVSTPYRLGNGPDSSQGEGRLEGLWRVNREQGALPSFAIDVGVEQPYGAQRGGTEALVKGIMTKSLGQAKGPDKVAQLHLNLVARHNFNPLPEERSARYMAGAALSRQLSEHWLVVGTLFSEQQRQQGEVINMSELGVRWKLSEQTVLSGALGYGFNGPARHRVLLGVQRSLD